jgi:hypothetical protein
MFNSYSLDDLSYLVSKWHMDRGITENGTVQMQFIKLIEEVGELAAAIARNKIDDAKDAIGDCLVLLNIIAELQGTSLKECWNLAYEEIKDREGYLLSNGNFIKSTDPTYNEMVKQDKEKNNG